MQNDLARLLVDEKGRLKPFDVWMRDIRGMTDHYVRSWLRTEYSTAVIRAHQAADWKHFEDEADVLPNLRWMPTTSPDQDPLHRQYWERKLTLPVGHPFWDEHRPGDRWNCKCSLAATDKPADDSLIRDFSPVPKQPGLDNNPGKDGRLFSDTHPYFTQAFPGAKNAVRKRVRSEQETAEIKERWETRRKFNENMSEVEKKLKLEHPSREMTFDEANELRGNPKYRDGRQYQINCQVSVVANEMRRRGLDVSARPNRRMDGSVPTRLSYQTELIWKDQSTGKPPKVQTATGETCEDMMEEFRKKTQTAGRYHLRFYWNTTRGGHIITFERSADGSGKFYDPQCGRSYKEGDFYSDKIRLQRGIEFYRVDNLHVDADMISGAVTVNKKKEEK